jgi:hypothetical protein
LFIKKKSGNFLWKKLNKSLCFSSEILTEYQCRTSIHVNTWILIFYHRKKLSEKVTKSQDFPQKMKFFLKFEREIGVQKLSFCRVVVVSFFVSCRRRIFFFIHFFLFQPNSRERGDQSLASEFRPSSSLRSELMAKK